MKILPAFALLSGLGVSACGETVSYDTQEKLLIGAVSTGDAQAENNGLDPSNANGGDGSGGADGVGNGVNQGPQALCAGRTLSVQNEVLKFPEIPLGYTCSFGQGEMLSRKDGFMRAYIRQDVTLTLPENAILCGFELTHREENMRYDDEMFFLLKDKILLATKDYSEYFSSEGMLRTWDWEKLKNQVYNQFDPRPLYCVGGAEGFSNCELPPTDTRGKISLEMTPDMSETLARSLGSDRQLNFSWITTGDDNDSDCRHTAIEFDVKLQYVLP